MAESKYQTVRAALEQAIVSGEYMAGDQLPAELHIARHYDVSVMTARRAVSELVAADLLERRARRGTFVRRQAHKRLQKVTVNLITTTYEGPSRWETIDNYVAIFEREGWHSNVVRLAPDQQDSAVRLLESGDYGIIFVDDIRPTSALWYALRASRNRVVSLYPDLSDIGVPSVMTDLAEVVRMAWERLQGAGHKRIAIISQFPSDEGQPENAVSWQNRFMGVYESLGLDMNLIRVNAPIMRSPTQKTYDAVREYLKTDRDITAMISMGDEMTIGALAACRDAGRPCPDRISMVCICDSPLMKFSLPAVSSVDMDFVRQLTVAADILKARINGAYDGDMLCYTAPQFVARDSVRPPEPFSSQAKTAQSNT